MHEDSQETREIIQRALAGDAAGWTNLVERYRDRLQRMKSMIRVDAPRASVS